MSKSERVIHERARIAWLAPNNWRFCGIGLPIALAIVSAVTTPTYADLQDEVLKRIPKLEIPNLATPVQSQDTSCTQRPLDVPICKQKLIVGPVPGNVAQQLNAQTKFARSFATVADALNAHSDDSCAANIVLNKQNHSERISIDRDASISRPKGITTTLAGSITVNGPHSVKIRGLELAGIRSVKTSRGIAPHGGIDINNPCAAVTIVATIIHDMTEYGVRQYGGKLKMSLVTVERTRRAPGGSRTAAIDLGGGVEAQLTGVHLKSNEARGLFVHGKNTQVNASALEIQGTILRSRWFQTCTDGNELLSGYGAVETSHNGRLTFSGDLFDNNLLGLYAHTGGAISLTRGKVMDTGWLEPPRCVKMLGAGAMAWNNGSVALESFEIARSQTCGIYVAPGGLITAKNGIIRESEIGACVKVPGYPLDLINDNIRWIDNNANIEASSMPTPTPLIIEPEG